MIFSVFKIFVSNIFSFGNFMEGFKKGPKGIFKNIAITLLMIYSFCVLGGLYIVNMNNFYNALSATGNVYAMPLISIFIAMVMTLLFGFISAASNYYTGNGEEQFLSMPLRPVDIFGAKFGVTLLTDALFGVLILAISTLILAARENLLANPLLYVGIIVTSITVGIISVFIIYLLLALVLTAFPSLRKKQILSGIATAFLIIFAIGYGFLGSQVGIQATEENGFSVEMVNNAAQQIGILISKIPALKFLSMALVGKIIPILLMAVICAIVLFVFIPLIAPLYIKTLNGFADVKTKKISTEKVKQVLDSKVKSQSVFKAPFLRDVRTILREPSFFSNGPFIIFLLPVIFIVSFAVSFISIEKTTLSQLIGEVQNGILNAGSEKQFLKYIITMAGSGIAIFLGNSTSIAATSFSREGKSLYELKSLPIRNEILIKVKFFHALTYVFIADIMILAMLLAANIILGSPFSLNDFINLVGGIVVLTVSVSISLIFLDMFLDTANPKLQWENPTAAFKQNINSVLSVLFSVAIISLGAFIAFLAPKNTMGIIIICVIFIVIDAPVGSAYFRYAEKKIDRMG